VASNTGLRLRRCLALGGAMLMVQLPALAGDRPAGGIWKYAVPPATIRGEFNSEDPLGLAAGAHIPTDCSMNWIADGGEVYCFATGTSLLVFQDSPQAFLARAWKFFHESPQAQ
jgi:hypothetical protein